jgi:hypothetical protein
MGNSSLEFNLSSTHATIRTHATNHALPPHSRATHATHACHHTHARATHAYYHTHARYPLQYPVRYVRHPHVPPHMRATPSTPITRSILPTSRNRVVGRSAVRARYLCSFGRQAAGLLTADSVVRALMCPNSATSTRVNDCHGSVPLPSTQDRSRASSNTKSPLLYDPIIRETAAIACLAVVSDGRTTLLL